MREKIARFMAGRYGVDQLNRFLLAAALACMVVSILFRNGFFNLAAIVWLVLSYYRMLSKNHGARYKENAVYLKYSAKVKGFFKRQVSYVKQSKDFHIYKCPSCKQKIRIPRGKGKISITCPKCKAEFVKKS